MNKEKDLAKIVRYEGVGGKGADKKGKLHFEIMYKPSGTDEVLYMPVSEFNQYYAVMRGKCADTKKSLYMLKPEYR